MRQLRPIWRQTPSLGSKSAAMPARMVASVLKVSAPCSRTYQNGISFSREGTDFPLTATLLTWIQMKYTSGLITSKAKISSEALTTLEGTSTTSWWTAGGAPGWPEGVSLVGPPSPKMSSGPGQAALASVRILWQLSSSRSSSKRACSWNLAGLFLR